MPTNDLCPVCGNGLEEIYEMGIADPVLRLCGTCGWGSRVHRRVIKPHPLRAEMIEDLKAMARELKNPKIGDSSE